MTDKDVKRLMHVANGSEQAELIDRGACSSMCRLEDPRNRPDQAGDLSWRAGLVVLLLLWSIAVKA